MPHSVTPDAASVADPSQTDSEVIIKSESNTQDVAMADAPSPADAEAKAKVNLEDLFDDDSDGEFGSSVPVKIEEGAAQPAATLYVHPPC